MTAIGTLGRDGWRKRDEKRRVRTSLLSRPRGLARLPSSASSAKFKVGLICICNYKYTLVVIIITHHEHITVSISHLYSAAL